MGKPNSTFYKGLEQLCIWCHSVLDPPSTRSQGTTLLHTLRAYPAETCLLEVKDQVAAGLVSPENCLGLMDDFLLNVSFRGLLSTHAQLHLRESISQKGCMMTIAAA